MEDTWLNCDINTGVVFFHQDMADVYRLGLIQTNI